MGRGEKGLGWEFGSEEGDTVIETNKSFRKTFVATEFDKWTGKLLSN